MKRFLLLFILLISNLLTITVFSWWNQLYATNCSYDVDSSLSPDVWNQLDSCLQWSSLVDWNDVSIDWGWWFGQKIRNVVYNISLYLWVFAVWSIVYGWLMWTISAWEEEKITKGKNIIKWGIIWFIWLISVSTVINLVVKIMYSI